MDCTLRKDGWECSYNAAEFCDRCPYNLEKNRKKTEITSGGKHNNAFFDKKNNRNFFA